MKVGQQCGHLQSIERRRVVPLVVRMRRFVNLSLLPTSPRVGFTVSRSASSAATDIVSSCRQNPRTGSRPAVRPYQIVSSCRLVQIASRPAVRPPPIRSAAKTCEQQMDSDVGVVSTAIVHLFKELFRPERGTLPSLPRSQLSCFSV